MGSQASGELSDLSFFIRCEQSFILRDDICSRYNIKGYARCRDDLFLVAGQDLAADAAFQADWDRIYPHYKVRKWESSFFSVVFLDTVVFKGPLFPYGRLDTGVHFKATSLGVPLNFDSHHPRACVSSWPFAEVRRFFDDRFYVQRFS